MFDENTVKVSYNYKVNKLSIRYQKETDKT